MSHEITIRENGFAEIAYVGKTPWHTLGNRIDPDASIEEWQPKAGLDWSVLTAPVLFEADSKQMSYPSRKVLYRSDNHHRLSIMADKYKIVQPKDILEFFRELVEERGFRLEVAGSLKGGAKVWALANTGNVAEIVPGDILRQYLLLATACDGTLATTGMWTSVRVVCDNTMQMAMVRVAADIAAGRAVKVNHRTEFDPVAMKDALGLSGTSFTVFINNMKKLAEKQLSNLQAEEVIIDILRAPRMSDSAESELEVIQDMRDSRGFRTIMNLFQGAGKGANLEGVRGSAWGLINAFTEYSDFHARSRSQDNRLNSAWFGAGANLKEKAVAALLAA